ncbi:MAG: hypothetical protein CMP91_01735 [Gammaproteobacteria bacterium]|nr:hypothetical protein [Gammaproteobacteria bacterium]MAY01842.1 hypothetical protein [Gammaproteobacteria bacterium]|tara:strand:+ start:875 stop:1096 length:222 start_codon:yes stop_codon:yes gene_type:complete
MPRIFIRKCLLTALFIAAIACLQLILRFGSEAVPQIQQQTALIEEQGINPSALFYTESRLALQAEKKVRKGLP